MPTRLFLFLVLGISMTGCHAQNAPPVALGTVPGPIYASATHDDEIRLLGEDKAPPQRFDVPYYQLPGAAIGATYDALVVFPVMKIYGYFNDDSPAHAARNMIDQTSADNRRYGILRLSNESYARKGVDEQKLWASFGQYDKDYTVRAAGIRAVNRSRAKGHTDLFLLGLRDQEPLVRLEAAKALANLPDTLGITPLEDHLRDDASIDVRIACADALRAYRNDDVAHRLIDVLSDPNFAIAWQARQSLVLMTRHDFAYNSRDWTSYLATSSKPYV